MFNKQARTLYYRISENSTEAVQGWVIGESRWSLFVIEQISNLPHTFWDED